MKASTLSLVTALALLPASTPARADGGAGAKPVRIRMMGGTVPTHAIVTPLRLPFVLVPLVNADDSQHSFDENLRIGTFVPGMRTLLGVLLTDFRD